MLLTLLRHFSRSNLNGTLRRGRPARPPRRSRPRLEALEDRTVPAVFFQGFETDTAGWDVYGGQNDATRVPSGTHGIASRTGDFHAEAGRFTHETGGSAATDWGGHESVFPGTFSTSVGIYLDVENIPQDDTRFDWTSGINDTEGNFRRDFAFNVGGYTAGGNQFVISASHNAGRSGAFPKNPARDPVAITASGWYTFKHTFYDKGGVLAADMSVIRDATNATVKTWTLSMPDDVMSGIGGNADGWFASNEFPVLAFDDSGLEVGVASPRQAMTDVLNDLLALHDGVTNKKDHRRIDDAIDHLQHALHPSLWVDDSHLRARCGDEVFNETRKTVKALRGLLENRSDIPRDVIEGFITTLVEANQELASVAIRDAIRDGGKPRQIDKAHQQLTLGLRDAAANQFGSAINHFRNAWEHAVKAVS